MNELTEINNAIYAAEGDVGYDTNIKYLLSLKPVLAHILKGTAKEFFDMTVEEIVPCIEGEPFVAEIPIDPGLTNLSRISGTNTEDKVPNEGWITYDVKFFVKYPNAEKGEPIKLIVDVEAQLDFYPGYEIVTRGIYYAARSISSQKTREFVNSNYQDIKKVYSIWICANPSKQRSNTIVEYSISEKVLFGDVKLDKATYDLLSVVLIALPEDGYTEDKPTLLGMLKTILTPTEDKEVILNRLEKLYGIPRTIELERRIGDMCNLSVGIMEKGIQQGIQQGENKSDKLMSLLFDAGRIEDAMRAAKDKEFKQQLYEEFNL